MGYGDRKGVTTAADTLGAEGFWIAERNMIPRTGPTGPVLGISVTDEGLFMKKGGMEKPGPRNDKGDSGGNQGGKGSIDMGRGSKKMPSYMGGK